MTSGRLGVGDVPGLKSVASATGTPRSMNVRAGAMSSCMRNQVVAGRRTATTGRPACAAAASASMPGLRRRGEVVRRERADLRGELRAAARCQLVGVQPRPEPEPRGGLEDPSRLLRAEDAALAEDVGEARPALRDDARQLLLDEVPDVGLRAVRPGTELRGDRVRAEPRREDLDRALLAELVGDLEQAQLGRQVEPVAGLRLDRRRAVGQHLAEPAPAVLGELVLGRGARRRDGRQDPAAGLEDLEVVGAALAQDQLVLAGAGEQQVGVRVDQAGRDRAARGVEAREAGDRVAAPLERAEQLVARTGREDPALPARDRRRGIVACIAARRRRRSRRRPSATRCACRRPAWRPRPRAR